MRHILHDWNLEQKRWLIASAYEALPTEGALLVYEALIDDERRQNAFGLLMSLNMLIDTTWKVSHQAVNWSSQVGISTSKTWQDDCPTANNR